MSILTRPPSEQEQVWAEWIVVRAQFRKTQQAILHSSHDILGLSTRATNCLRLCDVRTVEAITKYTIEELLRFPNLGKRTAVEIETRLNAAGFALKEKTDSSAP